MSLCKKYLAAYENLPKYFDEVWQRIQHEQTSFQCIIIQKFVESMPKPINSRFKNKSLCIKYLIGNVNWLQQTPNTKVQTVQKCPSCEVFVVFLFFII